MSEMKSITINGSKYGLPDPKSVLKDTTESSESTWSSQKIDQEVEEAVNPALIVCEALGEVITASDSANYPLHGLFIYGKTVQNGTPTPENPVPLESVGAGGAVRVTVAGKNLIDCSFTSSSVTSKFCSVPI